MKKVLALLLMVVAATLVLNGCGSKEEIMEEPIAESDLADDTSALTGEDIPLASLDDDAIYVEPLGKEFMDIHFEYDQYRIIDSDEPILEGIADWLKENPDTRVLIEGHCDERGTNEYNMALGEQRALAARRYLVGLGIDSDRLTTISYGEERPLIMGSNEAAWAENRRGHFAVSL